MSHDAQYAGTEGQDRDNYTDSGEIGRLEVINAKLLLTLRAIVARIQGDYDNTALVTFGPLSSDSVDDIQYWARAAIAKAEEA